MENNITIKQQNCEPSDLIHVAIINAVFGIKGDVKLHSFTSPIEYIFHYKTIYDINFNPYNLKRKSSPGKGIVASIAHVKTRNDAEKLVGTSLYIKKEQLEKTLVDEYYHFDLIDLSVFNVKKEFLGKVVSIYNFGAGDVIEILGSTKKVFMLPFNKEIVKEVNLSQSFILVDDTEYPY